MEGTVTYVVLTLVALLLPVIVQAVRYLGAKTNETKIGSQTNIDDLFFSQLKLAVSELSDKADEIRAKYNGSIPPEEAAKLRATAIQIAKDNLKHHGQEFLNRLPEEASNTFINWWVEYMKRGDK